MIPNRQHFQDEETQGSQAQQETNGAEGKPNCRAQARAPFREDEEYESCDSETDNGQNQWDSEHWHRNGSDREEEGARAVERDQKPFECRKMEFVPQNSLGNSQEG